MSAESLRDGAWMAVLVLGVLTLAFGATGWAYARRPAWAGLPEGPDPYPLSRGDALTYALLFASILAVCVWKVVPHWRMQIDEERDALTAALCGAGRACPLVGNEMNRLRLQLGPLNRYFMAACWVVTPDPRLVLAMILVLHAGAAVWAARIADSLLGRPAGLAAGVLLGTNSALLEVYTQPSNGSWVTVFLVGALWAALRWVRGDGGVPFVTLVTSIVCATQLHGTAFVFVPVALLAALVWRPRTPRWAFAAAAVVFLVASAPWLRFQVETRWSGLRQFSATWFLASPHGPTGGPSQGLLARALAPLRSIGPLVALVVLGVPALVFCPVPTPAVRQGRRALLLFLTIPLGAAVAGASVASEFWVERYNVPYLPAAALVAAAALALPGRTWFPGQLAAQTSDAYEPSSPLEAQGARELRTFSPLGLKDPQALEGTGRPDGQKSQPPRGPERLTVQIVQTSRWLVTLPVVAFIANGSLARTNQPDAAYARSRAELSLAETLEAVRALGSRGFRAQDLESRIHGPAWNRWDGAQVYVGHWLLGVQAGVPPTEDVLVTECAPPAGFAVWQHPLAAARGVPHVLVGYRPFLGPVRLVFDLGGTVWSHDAGTPFFMEQTHTGDSALRTRLDPALAFPTELGQLTTLWLQAPQARRRVRMTSALAPGPNDRAVVLIAPAELVPTLTVAGRPRAFTLEQSNSIEASWRYVVSASDRAAESVDLAVTLDMGPSMLMPRRLDLFEEPLARCRRP